MTRGIEDMQQTKARTVGDVARNESTVLPHFRATLVGNVAMVFGYEVNQEIDEVEEVYDYFDDRTGEMLDKKLVVKAEKEDEGAEEENGQRPEADEKKSGQEADEKEKSSVLVTLLGDEGRSSPSMLLSSNSGSISNPSSRSRMEGIKSS